MKPCGFWWRHRKVCPQTYGKKAFSLRSTLGCACCGTVSSRRGVANLSIFQGLRRRRVLPVRSLSRNRKAQTECPTVGFGNHFHPVRMDRVWHLTGRSGAKDLCGRIIRLQTLHSIARRPLFGLTVNLGTNLPMTPSGGRTRSPSPTAPSRPRTPRSRTSGPATMPPSTPEPADGTQPIHCPGQAAQGSIG